MDGEELVTFCKSFAFVSGSGNFCEEFLLFLPCP